MTQQIIKQSNIEIEIKSYQDDLKMGKGLNCHDESIVLIDSAFPNKPAMTKEQLYTYRMALADLPVACVLMAAKAFIKGEVKDFDGRFMPPAPAVAMKARDYEKNIRHKIFSLEKGIDAGAASTRTNNIISISKTSEAERGAQVADSIKRLAKAGMFIK